MKRQSGTLLKCTPPLSSFVIPVSTIKEKEGKSSETDSIKFKISSKTPRGKEDSTKRHHHRHHKRQPGEQQFPIQVVTGYSNI